MFNIKHLAVPMAICGLALSTTASAWTVPPSGTISSYLTGIGVSVPDAASAPNSPGSAWAPSVAGVAFTAEDSVGGDGYVGPGYGGQLYDLEALYVQTIGSYLVITGISGANLAAMPVGASGTCGGADACHTFPIGDFFIGTGSDANFNPVVGIEVTGQHYDMDGNGYTVGWTSPLTAGSVVDVNGADLVNGGFDRGLGVWNYVGSPSQIAANGYTGDSALRTGVVTMETINGHSAFRAVIDTQLLGSVINNDFIVHWGELCGNDFLRTDVSVPEPGSLTLLAAGLMGALLLGSRRRRWPAK